MYQCTEAERDKILEYIAKEPEMNLFFFGDIENFGVDREPVSIFAFPSADGSWNAILLKYFDFYIVYSQTDSYCASEVAAFLKGKTIDCVSGKTVLIEKLAPTFPDLKIASTFMSRCDKVDPLFRCIMPKGLRRLGPEDADDITALLAGIEEFEATYRGENALEKNKKQLLTNMEHGSVYFGVFCDSRLVSVASTSAANSRSAMVVGVATQPDYRGRGYASAVVSSVCTASFAEGKAFLCLFYDNPDAGRIYNRIGFREIGEYAMLR